MSRKRMPWFRMWSGYSRHEKVAPLDDHTFRVWHELLDEASIQKVRGRFASLKAAAAIVRRSQEEIQAVIDAGLVDVDEDGQLLLHDWQIWQRRGGDGDDELLDEEPDSVDSHRNGTNNAQESSAIRTNYVQESRANQTNRVQISDVKKRELREETRDTGDTPLRGDPAREARAPARGSPPGPVSIEKKRRGNARVQGLMDALAALKVDVDWSERDFSAAAKSTAPPELVAECYEKLASKQYGDDFMRKRLSIHYVINEAINGYREHCLEQTWEQTGDQGAVDREAARLRFLKEAV